MAESNLTTKYLGSMVVATVLWIVPPPLKLNPAITTFALAGSVAGYAYSFSIAKPLAKDWKQERRNDLKEERIANYTMALTEKAEKRELEQLFSPLKSAVSEVVSGVSEKVSEMRAPAVVERGFSFSETAETPETRSQISAQAETAETPETRSSWTVFNLSLEEAKKMLAQAASDGMSKVQILELFWEVKPGGSKSYREAVSQYEFLTQLS